ncbi:hypothetical protein Tco_1384760 [Tanacetum coccineum]
MIQRRIHINPEDLSFDTTFEAPGDDFSIEEEVHTLLMDGTLTSFNMLVEKRYPLIKEMLQKMLNWKLEAEAESTMAFELLKFIKSQLEE